MSLSNAERQKQIINFLRENHCILIWDNFQSVAGYPSGMLSAYSIAEQKMLRDFLISLKGGKTLVILTSRRDEPWLGDIYGRLQIQGLPLPEAQDLAIKIFKQRGFLNHQIKNLASYNAILQQSHGNPLALQMLLPELRRNIDDVIQNFLPKEQNAGPGRAFAFIAKARFDTLDPVYKKRMAIIGMFREHVAPRVLAAISSYEDAPDLIKGFGREDWIRFLDSTCELGLLRRSLEGPYSIPHALDRFYFNLLLEVFPDHLSWLENVFCTVCGRAGNQLFQIDQADKELALSLLNLEQHNLMHAYRLARQHKDWDSLKDILCGLRSLLITQGRWTEWDQIITSLESEVLEIEQDLPSDAQILWFRLLGHRAEICERRLDKQQLMQMHQMLKNRYDFLGSGEKHNEVLDDLGAIANHHGMIEESERFYLKSLALNRQLDDQAAQAQTCERLGELALQQQNFRETEKWFHHALLAWECLGNKARQAGVLNQLGKVANVQEKSELAQKYIERARLLNSGAQE
jgi:hypothetical protein